MTHEGRDDISIETILSDMVTTTIFKEFLRTQNCSEYLSAWSVVNKLIDMDRIDRPMEFSKFKRSYIYDYADRQLFIEYPLRSQLEKAKLPDDAVLLELKEAIVSGLEDGYMRMISDPNWRKQLDSRTAPKWAKKRRFGRSLERRESDEVLMDYFKRHDRTTVH